MLTYRPIKSILIIARPKQNEGEILVYVCVCDYKVITVLTPKDLFFIMSFLLFSVKLFLFLNEMMVMIESCFAFFVVD